MKSWLITLCLLVFKLYPYIFICVWLSFTKAYLLPLFYCLHMLVCLLSFPSALIPACPRTGQALKSGMCSLNSLLWDSVDHSRHFFCQNLLDTKNNFIHGQHQMVNTQIRLIIFFAAKNGKSVYNQQKKDQALTVAQIISSIWQNSGSNLGK